MAGGLEASNMYDQLMQRVHIRDEVYVCMYQQNMPI